MATKALQILMVEDNATDGELVKHELASAGLKFNFKRVETDDEFRHELRRHPPDVVLSDHGLPTFDALTALAIVRDRDPDGPFIFVTSSMGENEISNVFERGATDCVLKHRLADLPSAVRRALSGIEEVRRRKTAEAERDRLAQELMGALAEVKRLSKLVHLCVRCKKVRDDRGIWLRRDEYLESQIGSRFCHGICPDCSKKNFPDFR